MGGGGEVGGEWGRGGGVSVVGVGVVGGGVGGDREGSVAGGGGCEGCGWLVCAGTAGCWQGTGVSKRVGCRFGKMAGDAERPGCGEVVGNRARRAPTMRVARAGLSSTPCEHSGRAQRAAPLGCPRPQVSAVKTAPMCAARPVGHPSGAARDAPRPNPWGQAGQAAWVTIAAVNTTASAAHQLSESNGAPPRRAPPARRTRADHVAAERQWIR